MLFLGVIVVARAVRFVADLIAAHIQPDGVGVSSAVNMLDPSFLEVPLTNQEAQIIANKLNTPLPPRDQLHQCKDVLLLFLRICASAYEEEARCRQYLNNLALARRATRRVFENCSCIVVAWGTVIVVAFKGTSPFNLNEWLCDFSIKKAGHTAHMAVLGCNIGGRVHSGFYHALFPPGANQGYPTTPFATIVATVHEIMQAQQIRPEDLNLWVTGHSLGAAVATMFVTVLATATKAVDAAALGGLPDDVTPAEREAHANLRAVAVLRNGLNGVVTFGNPRVVDNVLAHRVDHFLAARNVRFLRVRNGNDVVSTVPLDFEFVTTVASVLRYFAPEGAINDVALELDYNYVGEGVRFSHTGRVMRTTELDNQGALLQVALFVPRLIRSGLQYATNTIMSVVTAAFTPLIPQGVFGPGGLLAASRVRRDTFLSAAIKIISAPTLGVSTLLTDHIPSEYFKHIGAARAG